MPKQAIALLAVSAACSRPVRKARPRRLLVTALAALSIMALVASPIGFSHGTCNQKIQAAQAPRPDSA